MGIKQRARGAMTAYAIGYLRWNPKPIFDTIRTRFFRELKPFSTMDFAKAVRDKLDLVQNMPKDDKEELEYYLSNPRARRLYWDAVRPKLEDDIVIAWIEHDRPDIWRFIVLSDDPAPLKYIKNEFRRAVARADQVARDLERQKAVGGNVFEVEKIVEPADGTQGSSGNPG